jgi:hypothetical protein
MTDDMLIEGCLLRIAVRECEEFCGSDQECTNAPEYESTGDLNPRYSNLPLTDQRLHKFFLLWTGIKE